MRKLQLWDEFVSRNRPKHPLWDEYVSKGKTLQRYTLQKTQHKIAFYVIKNVALPEIVFAPLKQIRPIARVCLTFGTNMYHRHEYVSFRFTEPKEGTLIEVTYAPQTDKNRSLTDILTIESGTNYDTIYLGSIESNIQLGFVTMNQNGTMEFVPATSMDNPYPVRSSYTSCLFDAFTMIANDLDLAIEFTIAVNRKASALTGQEAK